ncbi:MAG: F0F1 ATP synthase subunit A [Chloroflexota bacterium]|nr:F0F1 ATP synthase subunit A [Chloroflexota bacterium]
MQRINNPRTLVLLIVLVISLAVVSNLLKKAAGEAEEPEIVEDISPHVVFPLGPLEVTSTVVYTWAMMLMLGAGAYLLGRNLKIRPGPVQNMLELIVEGIEKLIREMVGVEDTYVFLPIVGTLAFFIGSANLVGLIPGLKSPTPDINTPLAMALVVLFSVPYFGIRTRGLWAYLKHYVEPIFLMLPIEIASEIARTLSLTFRLFGNIMGEEIIISVLFIVMPLFVPVTMMLFSIFTGLLQAYVFTLLTCVYIGGAVRAHQ